MNLSCSPRCLSLVPRPCCLHRALHHRGCPRQGGRLSRVRRASTSADAALGFKQRRGLCRWRRWQRGFSVNAWASSMKDKKLLKKPSENLLPCSMGNFRISQWQPFEPSSTLIVTLRRPSRTHWWSMEARLEQSCSLRMERWPARPRGWLALVTEDVA